MTYHSPRIYIYKITFEEVPYYYYGVKKEKRYDEEYWGSPITNKWCWELYTPKKQILQFFEFSDEGWLEAQSIEKRLIKPFYNTDKWCLNERCGGNFSLKVLKKNGKRVGKISGTRHKENGTGAFGRSKEKMTEDGKKGTQIQKEMGTGVWGLTPEQRTAMGKKGGAKGGAVMGKRHYEEGTGIFSLSPEEKLEVCSMGGKKSKELGVGVHSYTKEEKIELGRRGGTKTKELGKGIHALTTEQMTENGKAGGKKSKELGLGINGLTKEQRSENGKKASREQRVKNGKKTSSQRWECLETGYISTAGGLSKYQKKRGIDTSKRSRIL
jgi:general stress protein YciG